MGERMPGRTEPRIKLAREALETILERLANSNYTHDVGVMLYGRRVGWNPAPGQGNAIVIRNPNNPNRFLPKPNQLNVHPSDDVETILPLGPFTQTGRREVNRELDAVLPMGETPLYLSIVRGIESFPSDAAAGRRHIVVITDGFNEQSNGGPQGVMKFRKDVEELLRRPVNQGLRLDILGFNLTPRRAEEQQSVKDLQELTAQTGGDFYPVQDPSGLLRVMEKSLGLPRYVVRPLRPRLRTGTASAGPQLRRPELASGGPGGVDPSLVQVPENGSGSGRLAETAFRRASPPRGLAGRHPGGGTEAARQARRSIRGKRRRKAPFGIGSVFAESRPGAAAEQGDPPFHPRSRNCTAHVLLRSGWCRHDRQLPCVSDDSQTADRKGRRAPATVAGDEPAAHDASEPLGSAHSTPPR
jgi:hypothetical protein